MRFTTALLSLFLLAIPALTAPLPQRELGAAVLAQRNEQTLPVIKRNISPEDDADDAIAYAWFNEAKA
ncbi:MAG: hypothetical protein Q9187_004310 [Circinaria calcarea]